MAREKRPPKPSLGFKGILQSLEETTSITPTKHKHKKRKTARPSFRFEDLPLEVRLLIYGFLGFPVDERIAFSEKVNLPPTTLRAIYKIDLNLEGKLSVPWSYGSCDRAKKDRQSICIGLMCTNSNLCGELSELLYGKSVFVVHTFNHRKPNMPVMSERSRSYITRILISFNAVDRTQEVFGVTCYQQALTQIITLTTPLVPNITYFGINLWSVQNSRIFPAGGEFGNGDHSSRSADQQDDLDLRDTTFLSPALLAFVKSHPTMETFAFLRDMQPKSHLNWGRNKENVRKALARDVRKSMVKVYET